MKTSKVITVLLLFLLTTTIKAQETHKDSLFFKIDYNYIKQSQNNHAIYELLDNRDIRNGAVYFQFYKIVHIVSPKKIQCFKKFAKTAKLYSKNQKNKLNEYEIIKLFKNNIVILVNKKREYIEVSPVFEIE
ncbi:hypothetical protein RCH18_000961 [Flavobacterium sp. PL11]|uniref:hypothetical protein n=1 Tax=Flavobacterium sp. PL11 TaxID=3071717 RepID=UPI002DFFAFA8|nr:hypothetical protein [Flavobacterium sp. PL11]